LKLVENITSIMKRISHAAMRTGRDPASVTLVAVTKGVGAERLKEAVEAGLRVFGESRVKEAEEKISNLEFEISNSRICWHMIGHLQRNKAKQAVRLFELIHSVDSVELMGLLNKYASEAGKVQRVLIEVKLSHEEAKHGVEKGKLKGLIKEAESMRNMRVEGLMTIPPYSDDPEKSRPYFKELKRLRDEYGLKELSMGMTNDFEIAVEEGATMVRVGTAIFGERGRG